MYSTEINVDSEDLDVPTILRVKSPSSQLEWTDDEENSNPDSFLLNKEFQIYLGKRRGNRKPNKDNSYDDDDESSSFFKNDYGLSH
ncbi:MAG: hypothetical protein MZV64_22135 [Ignavibacteriales bacterium]|nr:hypothetical protein [Ignavibacteriales bacterium]